MKLFDKNWWKQQLHNEHIIELNELGIKKPAIYLNTLSNLDKLKIGDVVTWTQASYFSGNVNGQGHMVPEVKKEGIIKNIILRKNNIKDYLIEISTYERDGNDDYETINNNNFQSFLNSDWDNFSEFGEIDELEINNPNAPKVGETYDVKVWWAGDNWTENDYLQKIYEPTDGTVGGAEGWYWSKGWKCVSINSNDIGFESPESGERFLYDNEKIRKSNAINELEVLKPKKYIPIVKPTKPDYITSEEGFIKLSNYFENINLKLQKEIGRLNNRNMSETGGIRFPLTIDKASKIILLRWFFENLHNFYEARHIDIVNKWWDESKICLEDLEKKDINELEINEPLKFHIKIPEQWNEKTINNLDELEQLFKDFAKINPKLFKYIDLEYIIGNFEYVDWYPLSPILILWEGITEGILYYYKTTFVDFNVDFIKFQNLITKQFDKRLIDFNEIEAMFDIKNIKKLNELGINKPSKQWDFTKYIPNFNPNDIKIGDKIKIRTINLYTFAHTGKVIIFDVDRIEKYELEDGGLFFTNNELGYDASGLIDINNNNKNKKLNESKKSIKDSFKEFIKFLQQELPIKEKYNIKLTKDKSKTTSFAHFDPNNNEITVYIKGRNLMDSWRSLAHEWKHLHQNINKELTDNSGEDGSPHENEANAFAGLVMRKWGKLHPEYYTQLVESKINELEVNNPNVTWQKVYDFFDENINISYVGEKSDIWSNIWDEFKEFSAPYDEKYPTDDWRKFFQLFTRSDLNKFYQGMKQIYNKHNKLNELEVNKPITIKFPLKIRDPKFYDRIAPILEKMGYKWGKQYNYLKPTEVNPWEQRIFNDLDDNNNIFKVTGLALIDSVNEKKSGKFLQVVGISDDSYINESQNKNEIFSAYHGRYKFDVSKAYDLIKQGNIKTKIKTYSPEVMHFLSHPEFSEANPEKYNNIQIDYNEPLGLIANFKDENDKNELILIDGNHRTRKAVEEKQPGQYIVMYDPNDVNKILTINNEIPKKLFSDDE